MGDLVGPATIEFGPDGLEQFRMIAVEGDIGAAFTERDGSPAVEFSWVGFDEMDQANGRAWAVSSGEMVEIAGLVDVVRDAVSAKLNPVRRIPPPPTRPA